MSRLRCLAGHRSSKRGRSSWLELCSSISPRSPFRALPRSRNLCLFFATYHSLCLDPIALGTPSSGRRRNAHMWVAPNSLNLPGVRVGADVDVSLILDKPDWGPNWLPVFPIAFNNEVVFRDKRCQLRSYSVGICRLSRAFCLDPLLQISSIFSSLNPSL